MLDKADFMELAGHILKGDQLIVRGSDVTTVTSIIDVLKVCVCIGVPSVCKRGGRSPLVL